MTPEIRLTRVGSIDLGIDGVDEHVVIKRLDDDIDHDFAHNWLLEQYYRESLRPGGYYCNWVTIVPLPHKTNECIGIIHHRYDV